MPSRPQLLGLRRRVWRRLDRAVRELVGPAPGELRRYEARCRQALRRPARPVPREELLERALASRLLFCGDYHTFRPSQAFCLELLERLVERQPEVALLLEMVPSALQAELTRWSAGGSSERELLRGLNYARTWGFPWANYRPLFLAAREHGVPILGINGPGQGCAATLAERDRWASEVIARSVQAAPRRHHLVLAGDLHVAPCHLPALTATRLRDLGLPAASFVLLQNSDDLYWRELACAPEVEALLLDEATGTVANGTPWARVESYLSWLEAGEDPIAAALGLSGEGGAEYTERILYLLEVVAGFLGLPTTGAERFSVLGADDPALETSTGPGRDGPGAALALAERDLVLDAACSTLYLARLDLPHAALAAAELLAHLVLDPRRPGPRDREDAFFARAWRAALVGLARRVLDPIDGPRRPSRPAPRPARLLVDSHLRRLGRTLSEGDSPRALALAIEDDEALDGQIARALGARAGDRLALLHLAGGLSREELGQMFLDPPAPGRSRAALAWAYRPSLAAEPAPLDSVASG